jgi:hypothetical protein
MSKLFSNNAAQIAMQNAGLLVCRVLLVSISSTVAAVTSLPPSKKVALGQIAFVRPISRLAGFSGLD